MMNIARGYAYIIAYIFLILYIYFINIAFVYRREDAQCDDSDKGFPGNWSLLQWTSFKSNSETLRNEKIQKYKYTTDLSLRKTLMLLGMQQESLATQ